MPIEMSTDKAVCSRCGTAYGRRRGNFPVSYAAMHKGTGYLSICKTCLENLYETYLAQSNDPKMAVRQVCRKLDIFWNEAVFKSALIKSSTRTVMTQYMTKINTATYAGKSYDDTLLQEGTLWSFGNNIHVEQPDIQQSNNDEQSDLSIDDIQEEVRVFWGSGYTPQMYMELEQRRSYWMSRFPSDAELDIGTEALIRQICSLELDINRDRAAGRSVEKSVTALNTLLGSANLKPVQKRNDDADMSLVNTPMGVWLYRYENERPLPEVDDDLKDVNKIKKYIFTWMGHLCKMLGLKNSYAKLYEDEIARFKVEHPEYDGDDDETIDFDLSSGEDGDGS